MTHRRTVRPFTLMEVLIAAAIFAGLSLALFAYAATATKSWQQLTIRKNRLNELLALDRAVEQIIPNIFPFTWPDTEQDIAPETPVLLAEKNLLRCAYLHRLNDLEEGAIRFAQLTLENGQLLLRYADRPFLTLEQAGDRLRETVLAEQVQALEFEYTDWDNDVTTTVWADRVLHSDTFDNVDTDRTDVPLAVTVTVAFEDGRTLTWFRRTMGNSYRERFGKWEPQDTP